MQTISASGVDVGVVTGADNNGQKISTASIAFYQGKLGFECVGTWQDPPVYAIVAREGHAVHFRCAEPPTANPQKYEDELLDAYLSAEDADALHAEYAAKGVEFQRAFGETPWGSREFVVKDCDGRLLAFGSQVKPRLTFRDRNTGRCRSRSHETTA